MQDRRRNVHRRVTIGEGFDDARRDAKRHNAGWYVTGDDRARADDGIAADAHAVRDDDASAEPDAVFDDDPAGDEALLHDRHAARRDDMVDREDLHLWRDQHVVADHHAALAADDRLLADDAALADGDASVRKVAEVVDVQDRAMHHQRVVPDGDAPGQACR